MAWLEWTILGLAFVSVVMAVAILVLSRRSLPDLLLAAFLGLWGITGGSGRAFEMLGVADEIQLPAYVLLRFVLFTTLVAFAITYPDLRLTRWRAGGLIASGVLLAGLVLVVAATPRTPEAYTVLLRDVVRPFMAATYVVGLALLGLRWLRSRPGDYRNQVAWGVVVFVFWCFHDGLGLVGYAIVLGHPVADALVFASPWTLFAGFIWGLGILFAAGLVGVATVRVARGRAATDDRWIALLSPYLLALTTLQVLDSEYALAGPQHVHVALDYLIVAFVVYGVLRFNVVDLDLKLKWGLKRGTVVAAFVTVFFIVTQTAEAFLTEEYGWAVGGVAAGLLVLAITPLQRFSSRLADSALPRTEASEAYFAYRRIQIYRAALEGALRDGIVNPREMTALRNLRRELRLSDLDHERLEADALEGRGGASAVG